MDEHYEASTVLGVTVRSLHLQLAEAKSFSKRVEIVNSYFTRRIPPVNGPCMVDAAVREIVWRQGCIRIAEVARRTGIGLRQFERRFVHDLGISPKLYARIVRFEAAMRKKASFPSLNWTEIAHQLDYHDQMHMVLVFKFLVVEIEVLLTIQASWSTHPSYFQVPDFTISAVSAMPRF